MEPTETNWLEPRMWGPAVLALILAATGRLKRKHVVHEKQDHPSNSGVIEATAKGYAKTNEAWEHMLKSALDRAVRAEAELGASQKREMESQKREIELMGRLTRLEAKVEALTAELAALKGEA